jgi:hypothetical protein
MKIRPVGTELLPTDGQTDRKTGKRTERQTGKTKEGRMERHYDVNSRLSKFRQRSYKQRRNWGASVKTEKLGKDGLTGVNRAPVPENLSSLSPCCVNFHIQLWPTVYLVCLIFEHGVNMLNRNVANRLPTFAVRHHKTEKAKFAFRRKPEISLGRKVVLVLTSSVNGRFTEEVL